MNDSVIANVVADKMPPTKPALAETGWQHQQHTVTISIEPMTLLTADGDRLIKLTGRLIILKERM